MNWEIHINTGTLPVIDTDDTDEPDELKRASAQEAEKDDTALWLSFSFIWLGFS
jgi:hypothetical protein